MHQLNFESFIHQINQLTNQGFVQGKIIFYVASGPAGKGRSLKFDTMVSKCAIETCIWSFSENLENYEKLI